MLLKAFFTSTCIMAQLGWKSKKAFDVKKDGIIASRGQYPKLMEG
jgi:hypothetical protein